MSVACPDCGRPAGQRCASVAGADRTSFHAQRHLAASRAARAANGGPDDTTHVRPRKKAVVRRFGAFLRLYGPLSGRTHAVLQMGHAADPDSPRGFLDTLDEEAKMEHYGKMHVLGTEFKLHMSGRPRPRLPSYGSATRRVLNLVWPTGCSLPPLACAGLKQMSMMQAAQVAAKLGQNYYRCEHCRKAHLGQKR